VKRKLFLGSGNAHKIEELRRATADLDLEILGPASFQPPPPPPAEPHRVFVANAIEKALAYARATRMLTLADDSGLEVDALGGDPGVDSAYYAGRPSNDARNNEKLLASMAQIADPERTARYRCVLALAQPGKVLAIAEGACEGAILRTARGSCGFGYDPLFLVWGRSQSFAELSPEDKDRISHRGLAFRRLREALPRILAENKDP
jgi:XTP/dITP diphosphohydrolase